MRAKFDNLSKINVCLISISHLQSQEESTNIMYFLTVTIHTIVQSTEHFDLQTYLCYKYNYNSYSYFTSVHDLKKWRTVPYVLVCKIPLLACALGLKARPCARDDRVSFIQRTSVN